jgi:hypothetical protein
MDTEKIVEAINEKYQEMLQNSFKPTTIVLPMKLFRRFYTINSIDKNVTSRFLMKDGNSLKAIFLPNSGFEEIILINQTFGLWTYKKQENAIAPLKITFEKNEDKLNIDIRAWSEIYLDISNPQAITVLYFPRVFFNGSRWSIEMFEMTQKIIMEFSEEK